MEFPIVKLLEYQGRESELEKNSNPFALVVLAYLKSLETKKAPDNRFQWKLRLFKLLYQQGYSKQDILELTRFVDWIMKLPKELEERFDEAVTRFEEELRMRYVTSFERIWTEKGVQQGLQQGHTLGQLKKSREAILEVLNTRFSAPFSPSIEASLTNIESLALLKELLKKSRHC